MRFLTTFLMMLVFNQLVFSQNCFTPCPEPGYNEINIPNPHICSDFGVYGESQALFVNNVGYCNSMNSDLTFGWRIRIDDQPSKIYYDESIEGSFYNIYSPKLQFLPKGNDYHLCRVIYSGGEILSYSNEVRVIAVSCYSDCNERLVETAEEINSLNDNLTLANQIIDELIDDCSDNIEPTEVLVQTNFGVFPTVSSQGVFNLEFPQGWKYEIWSFTGELVVEESEVRNPIHLQKQGTYFVRYFNDNQSVTRTFFKL